MPNAPAIQWEAVYAIGDLAFMLAGVAWRMSKRFTRIEGKVALVGRSQRRLRRKVGNLFCLHGARLDSLEDRLPAGNPDPHRPAAFGGHGLRLNRRGPALPALPRRAGLCTASARNPEIPKSLNPEIPALTQRLDPPER